jgi:hypothetical protein
MTLHRLVFLLLSIAAILAAVLLAGCLDFERLSEGRVTVHPGIPDGGGGDQSKMDDPGSAMDFATVADLAPPADIALPLTSCGCSGLCYQHSNGVGQSWYDCASPGTYDRTEAMRACAAWTGDSSCQSSACVGGEGVVGSIGVFDGSTSPMWVYTGPRSGKWVAQFDCFDPVSGGWN